MLVLGSAHWWQLMYVSHILKPFSTNSNWLQCFRASVQAALTSLQRRGRGCVHALVSFTLATYLAQKFRPRYTAGILTKLCIADLVKYPVGIPLFCCLAGVASMHGSFSGFLWRSFRVLNQSRFEQPKENPAHGMYILYAPTSLPLSAELMAVERLPEKMQVGRSDESYSLWTSHVLVSALSSFCAWF